MAGRGRSWAAIGAVTALVALACATVAPGAVPAAGASPPTFAMTGFRDVAVDPTTGDVLVSGDDEVHVFDASGTSIGTVGGLPGAAGLEVAGSSVWVAEDDAAEIAEVDVATRQVLRRLPTGVPVTGASLALIGGDLWFGSHETFERLDPTTGIVDARGDKDLGEFERVGSSTTRLITYPSGTAFTQLLDITADPVVALGGAGAPGSMVQVAVEPDHGTYLLGAFVNGPSLMPEASFTTGGDGGTGLAYPVPDSGVSVSYSPGHGGLIAVGFGTTASVDVWAHERPGALAEFTAPPGQQPVSRGIAQSVDGNRVYLLTEPSYRAPTKTLQTFTITPAITAVSPSSVVAGVPTTITLTGPVMGGVTAATVGGLPADVTVVSPTQVRVDVPTGVPAGHQVVSVVTPLGSTTSTVDVAATSGALLHGQVTASGPRAGIGLTLSGGGLGSPVTTTSDVSGQYQFSGVPYGTTYVLTAHDPTGEYPDWSINGQALVPPQTATIDVALSYAPNGPGAMTAQVGLPGPPRDLVVDPATNRSFVTVGDLVLVYDAAGVLVGRIGDQWGADQLALHGSDLYVNLQHGGAISRIDTGSLTVTGRWSTGRPTTGVLAFAGGRVWFTNGTDQFVGLSSLDPATGTVVDSPISMHGPGFRTLGGDSDEFYAFADYSLPGEGWVVDASAAVGTIEADRMGPVMAGTGSAALGKVWANGSEYTLPDLQLDGLTYPVGGTSSAASAARGGLVALGSKVSRVGVTTASHQLPLAPDLEAFDGPGDHVMYVSGSTLFVWDLHPHLVSLAPASIDTRSATLQLTGSGLGAVSGATVDGNAATFAVSGTDRLTVNVSSLSPGLHTVVATTPWGTSNVFTFRSVAAPERPFLPIVPQRLMDTRADPAYHVGSQHRFGQGEMQLLTVAGGTTPVPADATAVVLNVTAVDPTASSHVDVWPAGASQPNVSNLNFVPGQTVPNLVTVKVGSGGRISLFNRNGSVDVIADVVGYYRADAAGPRFTAQVSHRLVDTRADPAYHIGAQSRLGDRNDTRTIQVSGGSSGVPAGATAVVANVTVVGPSTASHLDVWPAGAAKPNVSNLNFVAGQTVPNLVVVKVGSGGAISLQNQNGSTDVIVDVVGYFSSNPSAAGFLAVNPYRIEDTWPDSHVGPILNQFGDRYDPHTLTVTGGAVPADAKAIVANVTVVDPTTASHLDIWPAGSPKPNASNLNYVAYQTVPNLVVVPIGANGQIAIRNENGNVQVIVDVVGYYR